MENAAVLPTLEILTFRVGPFLLGTEVSPVSRLTRLSPGVGGRTPLVDLRQRCDLEPWGEDTNRFLLVVGEGAGEVAYVVDQVGDLIAVNPLRQIWPLPALVEREKRWRQLWGVCEWGDELVLLVDLTREGNGEW